MLLRYSVGRVDLEAGLREAILTLRGLEETLIVDVQEFFEDEVLPTIRREALRWCNATEPMAITSLLYVRLKLYG